MQRWCSRGVWGAVLLSATLALAQKAPERQGFSVPRVAGRITAAEVGLVINTADPYSVEVGEYYAAQRGIPPEHIVRVELPVPLTVMSMVLDVATGG